MSFVRVLLCSLTISALALPLAAGSASAKPKKAKSSKATKPEPPADTPPNKDNPADDDDDTDAAPRKKSGGAKSGKAAASPDESEATTSETEHSDAPAADRTAQVESASTAARAARPSPFDLQIGLRAVNRNFTYKDTPADLFPNKNYPTLVPFKLPLGPALFFDGNVYPGAFATSGVAANIGLTFGYEVNFATKAIFAQGSPIERTLHTQASQFYLGARARIPFATHEVGLIGAYGQQKFQLTGDEGAPLAPDVHYKFVRLGVDAKFGFDDVSVGAHLGTRLVSDTGGLRTDWFPNTKTKSLELGALFGYRVSRALDVIAAIDFVRYVFDFNPIPPQTDPWSKPVAGGATDQYITGSLALRYHVPTAQ